MKLKKYVNFNIIILKGLLILMFSIVGEVCWGQTTFSWRNDQNPTSGQWNISSYWWNGSGPALPGGSEILFLDGNIGTTMTNDLPSTNRFRINFGATSATSRTINGSTSNTFFDYSNAIPAIYNNSGVTHTINFPIQIGNTSQSTSPNYGFELNAESGNLTIGSTISSANSSGTKVLVLRASNSGTGTITLNGIISNGSGTMSLSKIESNTAVLTAANTYTGTTTISAGTLKLNRVGGTTIPITNNVIVSAGTLQISSNQTLNDLTISSGGVTIDDGVTLTINGTLTYSGGSMSYGSTTLGNLVISSSGQLIVSSGASLITSGRLTLKSNATGTASIGNSAGSITGNVTVERYIASAGRRWRFLSSPVQSKTIADWRDQFCITGPGTTTNSTIGDLNSNGWHQTYNNITNSTAATNTSVRLYVEANSSSSDLNLGWGNVSTSTSLTAGQGFRAFIRGPVADKVNQLGASGNSNLQTAVTLSLTGAVNSGSVSAPSLTNNQTGWNLLGNPYPCAYNFNSMYDAGIGSEIANIDPNVYIYNGVTNSYTSFNASSNTGGLTNGIIPSGSSFFIQATGSPIFVFKEAYKTTTAPISLHKADISLVDFGIKYYKDSTESDFVIIKMFDGATLNNEKFDTKKITNENLNLSAYGSDSIDLMSSCIPFITEETRIKLNVQATEIGTYKFEFTNMDNFDTSVTVHLFDRFTNTIIDVKANTLYTFEMGAGENQWGKNRFELILNKNNTSIGNILNTIASTNLTVYPNPANDLLNVSINNVSFKSSNIVVYNVSGMEVSKSIMNGVSTQLNIECLSSGIYFVKISNENGFNKTVKFVK